MSKRSFKTKVDRKMRLFDDTLAIMAPGAKKTLLEQTLYDYCRISVQLDDIEDALIGEDGRLISTVDNGKGRMERNPDIMTQHQLLTEKNAFLPKLLKSLPDGEVKDALAAFVAE